MKLKELFQGLDGLQLGSEVGSEVTSLAYDSRRVQPGTLFFAIQGEKADGHAFIPRALERGAVAVVSERIPPSDLASRWVRVPRIRRALSTAGRVFFGQPDLRLKLIGITGTNGKTTTAFLVDSILRAAGIRTGLFGTIEYRVGDRVLPALNTTPESLDLWSYFRQIVDAGGTGVVMEVSSHALAQERVWGFPYAVAVFTNLTQDHLDYHKDFEHYYEAKRRLFEGLGTPPPQWAVINLDDPWGRKLLDVPCPQRLTYGMNSTAQVKVKHLDRRHNGLEGTIVTPAGKVQLASSLLGRVNLANILAATAASIAYGIPLEKIEKGLKDLKAVPGRCERIDEGQPFLVIVDYAHTDDALRNVLSTARELTHNRLIVVFGCGGERDRTKRPLMGEAAGSLSDLAVLTSDNPRGEDPLLIMSDALVGLQKAGKPYWAEVDREAAIRKAVEEAREGDVVVLAGKGHETYQILKDRTIPFDDREIARKVLREMGYHPDA
ncbi:MAG: UDP-N-acetylmuramoyl-L-alanyl-D-glutamate--2,6-diaminopimelate ligase [Terriglobia bacterium]